MDGGAATISNNIGSSYTANNSNNNNNSNAASAIAVIMGRGSSRAASYIGEVDVSAWRRRTSVILGWLKHVVKFVLSYLGLLTMVVVYAILGAFLFVKLEQPNELNLCITYSDYYYVYKLSMVDRLWMIVETYNDDSDYTLATDAVSDLLDEYKDAVSAALFCMGR